MPQTEDKTIQIHIFEQLSWTKCYYMLDSDLETNYKDVYQIDEVNKISYELWIYI